MKKFFTLLTIMLLGMQCIYGQTVTTTISGTITNSVSSQPIAGQAVYISADSSNGIFSYYNTVYTDVNGLYLATLSIPSPSQIVFYISTSNCNGAMATNTVVSSTLPMVSNFTIQCGTNICSANFVAYPDSSNAGLSYYFYDQSSPASGNITAWSWNFGDGGTSTLQYPHHTYANYGFYNVCLTISTNLGCTATHCDNVYADTSNVFPCQASFQYTENNNAVSFYGYSNTSGVSYFWTFGDSTTSNLQNPVHTYNGLGTYTVCLTISNQNGCSDTYCQTIALGNPTGCQATFYAYADSVNYLGYQFINSNSGVPQDGIYAWDFGDGTSSNLVNPYHVYSAPGTYMVCLYISDSTLAVVLCSYCDSVVADTSNTPACWSSFSYSVNYPSVYFYEISNNWISLYSWSFGDGTGSTDQNPIHQFAGANTYTVCLTTVDPNGCTYTSCQNIDLSVANICGAVYANGVGADAAYVNLIGFDSLGNVYSYNYTTYVDSMGYYCFNNVAAGSYLILASPSPNSTYYNDYLPTYFGDVINWSGATIITIAPGGSLPYNDINLVSTNGAVFGPGSISGNVVQGGNKVAGPGDPISDIEIMLLDNSNSPLASTYTNVYGQFVFSNLAYGTYKIYGEIVGLDCTPAIVTLDATTQDVNNIQVTINTSGIVASVNDELSEYVNSVGTIYPNPVEGNSSIDFSLLKSTNINVSIYNIVGQKMEEYQLTAGPGMFKVIVLAESLDMGIYTIQFTTPDGLKVNRKFTKN